MAHVKLQWNQEKVDKVIKIVDGYLTNNEADNSETVSQMDKPQINALWELACPLADIFEDDEYWDKI